MAIKDIPVAAKITKTKTLSRHVKTLSKHVKTFERNTKVISYDCQEDEECKL